MSEIPLQCFVDFSKWHQQTYLCNCIDHKVVQSSFLHIQQYWFWHSLKFSYSRCWMQFRGVREDFYQFKFDNVIDNGRISNRTKREQKGGIYCFVVVQWEELVEAGQFFLMTGKNNLSILSQGHVQNIKPLTVATSRLTIL